MQILEKMEKTVSLCQNVQIWPKNTPLNDTPVFQVFHNKNTFKSSETWDA